MNRTIGQLALIAMQTHGRPFERGLANLYLVSSESQREVLANGFSAAFDFWNGVVKDAIDCDCEEHPPVETISQEPRIVCGEHPQG